MKNIFIIILLIIGIYSLKGCTSNYDYSSDTTHKRESRYNTMSPADYHKEMKSINLQYADVAWHAQNTYGWNCAEIINMGNPINTNGQELRQANLISEIKGYYNVATCTSGVQLRVYPRKDSYPIITNINGGWE